MKEKKGDGCVSPDSSIKDPRLYNEDNSDSFIFLEESIGQSASSGPCTVRFFFSEYKFMHKKGGKSKDSLSSRKDSSLKDSPLTSHGWLLQVVQILFHRHVADKGFI